MVRDTIWLLDQGPKLSVRGASRQRYVRFAHFEAPFHDGNQGSASQCGHKLGAESRTHTRMVDAILLVGAGHSIDYLAGDPRRVEYTDGWLSLSHCRGTSISLWGILEWHADLSCGRCVYGLFLSAPYFPLRHSRSHGLGVPGHL